MSWCVAPARVVRLAHGAAAAAAVAVLVAPAAALLVAVAQAAWAGEADLAAALWPSPRRLALFGRTVLLAATAAALAMAVGVAAASAVAGRGRLGAWVASFLPVLVVVPPHLIAAIWATAVAGTVPGGLGALATGSPGGLWAICLAIQVAALLPAAAWLGLVALDTVDPAPVEAARLVRPAAATLALVVVPLAAPMLAAAAAVLFVTVLADHAVAGLVGVPVYALEVFAQYSADREPATALLTALPLVAIQGAAVAVLVAPLRRSAAAVVGGPRRSVLRAPDLAVVHTGAVALVIGAVAVPLVVLAVRTGSLEVLVSAVGAARGELVHSLVLAALAGAVGTALAWEVAARLDGGGRWWWLAATLPVALPAPLTGIGLAHLGTVVAAVDGIPAALAALVSRALPVAALVVWAGRRRARPELADAAAVYQRSPWHGLVAIRLPLAWPWLSTAAILVVALSLGELGASLVVAPPGRATLTMRLFNLLHVGAGSEVAALAVTLAAAALLPAVAAAVGPWRRSM